MRRRKFKPTLPPLFVCGSDAAKGKLAGQAPNYRCEAPMWEAPFFEPRRCNTA